MDCVLESSNIDSTWQFKESVVSCYSVYLILKAAYYMFSEKSGNENVYYIIT